MFSLLFFRCSSCTFLVHSAPVSDRIEPTCAIFSSVSSRSSQGPVEISVSVKASMGSCISSLHFSCVVI